MFLNVNTKLRVEDNKELFTVCLSIKAKKEHGDGS